MKIHEKDLVETIMLPGSGRRSSPRPAGLASRQPARLAARIDPSMVIEER